MLTDDFHGLHLPTHLTDAMRTTTIWYVQAIDDSSLVVYYLMNNLHGTLSTFDAPMGRFYFDTEADALEEMLVYYNFHNESFPYVDEYRLAKGMPKAPPAGFNRGILGSRQSQKMEFL